ncbi:MAG: DUF6106 family protein [Clostridiales bacterium]|nr:DUF6106 family protein [Clostridiales bacterium]
MNESYAEAGVKRGKTTGSYVAKFGIIFAMVLILTVGVLFIGSFAVILFALGIFVCYYMFPRFNVEYEYIYCDGQFDFDKILGNAKRKTMLRIDSDKIEMIAPVKSHALDSYNHMELTVKDYTSLNEDANVYAMIAHGEKGNLKILFEPSEKMITCIKQKTPRKISEY